MRTVPVFWFFVVIWYMAINTNIAQGYSTNTGQSYDGPWANNTALKNMLKWTTGILQQDMNKQKQITAKPRGYLLSMIFVHKRNY